MDYLQDDEKWMRQALALADEANGDVPVGCVVIKPLAIIRLSDVRVTRTLLYVRRRHCSGANWARYFCCNRP